MQQVTLSARIGAAIVHAAASRGASAQALQALTGFDPALAADPDARITLALETQLWEEAARLTGDDVFGLHAAELLRPGAFDVLEYTVRSAPNLREALRRAARYNRIEHDVAVLTLRELGTFTRVEHAFGGTPHAPCRHAVEFTFASHVVIGSQMIGRPMLARTLELRHAPTHSVSEYERLFGLAPRFGAAANAIEWDDQLLDSPIPQRDPVLSSVLTRHAESLLAALPAPAASYLERVRGYVLSQLGSGEVTLASAARQLKLSPRSLQRRLADEAVSFDALLDELRHQLALRYLADPKLAIAEVAYLLGYSEPSPFHRAVRRWTGATPSELRQRSQARPSESTA